MIFSFIDTNIWIRVLTQGRPGCELEHLTSLQALVDGKDIQLLVPEMVELELQKAWRDLNEEITRGIAEFESKIDAATKPKLWTEIEDIHGAVIKLLHEKKTAKIDAAKSHYAQIESLLKSANVSKIPLTSDILLRARKRMISGRMPVSTNAASNDAGIIESLLTHFETTPFHPTDQLYFCSENIGDFALKVDKSYVLHPLLVDGFPNTNYLLTLLELVTFHKSSGAVAYPPQPKIDEALEEAITQKANPKPLRCRSKDCDKPIWWFGTFCHDHFFDFINKLSPERQFEFNEELLKILKSLSYREREILKLRAGLSDGYIYTLAEVAHIFKVSITRIRQIEKRIIFRLSSGLGAALLEDLFERFSDEPEKP